jgi:hypothetical protein
MKIIIKNNDKKEKNKEIVVWIQKSKDIDDDLKQLFQFFKEHLIVKVKIRFKKFYKIYSKNPAIMISLLSAFHELIPEIYFNSEEPINLKNYNKFEQ